MIRVASVCSGIGGAELAFAGIGHCVFASEIEPFPRAVLAHHFPRLTVHHDFTEIRTSDAVDVLVGGTPCQSFSVAGLRGGMADARGNLALEFLRLADRLRARWVLWENVPGVLSSNGGRDFGAFVGGLAELGYGWAYRVLDAQFFGLAQRRKRVFVVGCLGDWRRAAAVLFEPSCLRGDTPPRREAREGTAGTLAARASAGGGLGTDFDCDGGLIAHSLAARAWSSHREDSDTLIAFGGNNTGGSIDIAAAVNAHGGPHGRLDFESETFIAHSLQAHRAGSVTEDGTGRGTPLVFDARQSDVVLYGERAGALDTDGHSQAVAFHQNQRAEVTTNDTAGALNSGGGKPGQGYPAICFTLHGADKTVSTATETSVAGSIRTKPPGSIENSSTTAVLQSSLVRRLTPTECERLQGYPDGWTDVRYRGKPAADGPRYRALGNAFAIPTVRWIARRLAAEHAADAQERAA